MQVCDLKIFVSSPCNAGRDSKWIVSISLSFYFDLATLFLCFSLVLFVNGFKECNFGSDKNLC